MDLVVSSPEALQKFVVGEMERWGKVVRENNRRARGGEDGQYAGLSLQPFQQLTDGGRGHIG